MTMSVLLFLIPALLALFDVRIAMGFQLGSPLSSSQSILARTSIRAKAASHLLAVGPLVLDQEHQEHHSPTIHHHHHRGHGKIVVITSKEQYSSFLAEDDRLCIIK
jgi:hypothetical protein